MRTISRRELAHNLAKTLDEVAATGEPVEIVTRNGTPLLISVAHESTYERWLRENLVGGTEATVERLVEIGVVATTSSSEEALLDIRGDR
jgi:antitoxin (DNA-binding transcriptional repressor) of toxin-antitoxin stability system